MRWVGYVLSAVGGAMVASSVKEPVWGMPGLMALVGVILISIGLMLALVRGEP